MNPLRLFRQWRLITDLASEKRRAQRDLEHMLTDLKGRTFQLTAESMQWELSVSNSSPPSLTVTPVRSTL